MKEFDLLAHIYAASRSLPAQVTIGPGDDMGAMRIGGATVLVTVDQIADGVHVDTTQQSLQRIGRKAITRNLSDVAAMAAKPVGAVAAACLPRDFGEARANELFDAMRTTAESYACPLIGGDIAMWDGKLLLTVTVFAEPAGIEPVLRRGARPGDLIYVTGELGNSIAGYHLDFEPRIAVARRLAGDPATRPHCMIDLSDGLGRDLGHLCEASHVAVIVRESQLPLRQGADWRNALGDGEDYELCFTAGPDQRVPTVVEGVRITRVGRIVPGIPGVSTERMDGRTETVTGQGWEHHGP